MDAQVRNGILILFQGHCWTGFVLVSRCGSLTTDPPLDAKSHGKMPTEVSFSVFPLGEKGFPSLVGKKTKHLPAPINAFEVAGKRIGPTLRKILGPWGRGKVVIPGAEKDQEEHSQSVNSG